MSTSIFEHPVLQRVKRIAVTLAVLLLLGVVMRPIESPAWEVVKAGQSELNLSDIEASLGQGLVVGVLGGFRTIMADVVWLQLNSVWQKKDRAKLDSMVRLVTTLDPRPDFFWTNSARMIAYDVPNWRIDEEGGYDAVPDEREYALNVEQAEQAFKLLERAREFHPDNAKLYLETAQIYLNRLKDLPNAAKWFLKASELPSSPRYAARIYAELLRRQDKNREAYDYLVKLHESLPDDDPHAQKWIVLERIRTLENTLKIPYLLRYKSDGLNTVVNPGEAALNFE